MNRIKKSIQLTLPAIRISFALALISACIFMGANFFSFIPNEDMYLLDSRKKISETIAIQFLVINPTEDAKSTNRLIRYLIKRNPEIISAAIRSPEGHLVYQSSNHEETWQHYSKESTLTHVIVPLIDNGILWGNAEIQFKPPQGKSTDDIFLFPLFKTLTFLIVIGFFSYLAFMIRTLRQLDPSSVIPERVNAAFDTLSEGIVIIDENEHILMTNQSFCEAVDTPRIVLAGKKMSELDWEIESQDTSTLKYPWMEALKTGKRLTGTQLVAISTGGKKVLFSVNSSPIIGDGDKTQGVLITLADITEFQKNNMELKTIVSKLKQSQMEVKQKNKELTFLATHDPLTGCLNRRSLYEQFQTVFDSALVNKSDVCVLMVDIDHFKSINDRYGHARGDEIIRLVADVLKNTTRKIDLVGRYGGEEFSVVLPGSSEKAAFLIAERIRLNVFKESGVSVSIGLSTIDDQPKSPDDFTQKADVALYVAKRSGRNQIVKWKDRGSPTLVGSIKDDPLKGA